MLRPAPLPSPVYFPPATTGFASPPAPSYAVFPQFQSEMEGVEAALKSSFRKEMAFKSTQQAFLDDLCADNVQSGGPGDDFFVDELLDFPNEDEFVGGEGGREEEEEDEEVVEKASSRISVSLPQQIPEAEDDKNSDGSPSLSAKDDYLPVPTGELGVPADDVESLEWLSHFVEDSNSEYSIPFPAGVLPEWPKRVYRSSPGNPVSPGPGLKTPVLAKTRSKRSRAGVRIWLHGSSPLPESSSSSSSSGAATVNLHSTSAEKPPASKKQKKKPTGEAHPTRRCSHCGVQKTPQWRTGPMGSKTLCNACGVRYKSGRLLPEYRPASSPTFSSELHSNHHRKVLEMRRKKEVVGQGEPGWGPPEVVPSF